MTLSHCFKLVTLLPLGCLLTLPLIGCSARIIPPSAPQRPQTVLVTDYGRHSSLILPDGSGHLVEFMYGDWNWFALSRTNWYRAFEALLWSQGATMGVRHMDFDAEGDAQKLAQRIGCETVLRVSVDSPGIQTLREQLSQRVDQNRSTLLYNPVNGCEFVKDDEHYSLWNNCNHLTARWLVALGCQIEGDPVTSKFTLKPAP